MNKINYGYPDLHADLAEIIRQTVLAGFKPDLILAPTRGGLAPGVYLSHYFDSPFVPLDPTESYDEYFQTLSDYKVLLVDDICDSGKTLAKFLKSDGLRNFPNIKVATLLWNIGETDFAPDFFGTEINKIETPAWIVFPWENFWLLA